MPPVGEVEDIVVEMIENGTIFATIDRSTQMVSFHDDPRAFAGHSDLDLMTQRMKKMVDIAERVRDLDAAVTMSQPYVKAQVMAEKLRADMAAASESAEAVSATSASKK